MFHNVHKILPLYSIDLKKKEKKKCVHPLSNYPLAGETPLFKKW